MANDLKAAESPRLVAFRTMDVGVAAVLAALGALVMVESSRLGAGWAVDGPQSGYFPFYIGLSLFVASLGTIIGTIFKKNGDGGVFVDRHQFFSVLRVLVPTAAFVAAISYLGLYVSAALFIAGFMGWIGRYGPTRIAPVAVLVPLVLFITFEHWFLIALPKGPLEAWLGY